MTLTQRSLRLKSGTETANRRDGCDTRAQADDDQTETPRASTCVPSRPRPPKPSRAERDERVIEVVVGVRCPGCHATRTIRAGEIPDDDFPMCFACGLPMIVEAARTNIARKRRGAGEGKS